MQQPEADARQGASGVPTLVLTEPELHTACALVLDGDVREALAALTALRTRIDELAPTDQAGLLGMLVECRLARGDLAEAMVLGDELGAFLNDPTAPSMAAGIAHYCKGELAAALGNPEAALEHFLEVGVFVPDVPVDFLPWRAGAAVAMVRCGDVRGAAAIARDAVALAEAEGAAYARAYALRTLATADTSGLRVATLREARAVLAGSGAQRLAAQIDTDLAGLLLLNPSSAYADEALALLRSAESYAGHQELWPLQGRIRRLLDRLGEVPHRVQSEAMAALTPAERRVARLAADGLTNRQIAAELVVTVKAVEWHLSHVYRKLGISSRTRLAATLGAAV
jgi:ATP/maltotriose-dependent transcriptional regulator MalT